MTIINGIETDDTTSAISHYCVPCALRNRVVCYHPRIWRFTTCSLLGILLCISFILFHGYMEDLMQLLNRTDDMVCLLLFLIFFTIFSLPVVIPGYIFLNMAAGFRFGLVHGTIVTAVCVGIGSTLAFAACRPLLSTWMAAKIQNSYFHAIVQVVEGEHAFRVIAVTRLTPIPFGIQNGIFAISKIPVRTFIVASVVGSFPNQVLNTYMGCTMHTLSSITSQTWSFGSLMVFIAQACVSLTLSIYVVRKAQRHLYELTIDVHRHSMEEGTTMSKLPERLSTSTYDIIDDSPPCTTSHQLDHTTSPWQYNNSLLNEVGTKIDTLCGNPG